MGVLILIFCFLILLQNFIKARITEHEAETSKFFGQNFAERKKEKKNILSQSHCLKTRQKN